MTFEIDTAQTAKDSSLFENEALITVAVCSFNRIRFLRELLPLLLARQGLPSSAYKIIVVENSDDPQICAELAAEFRSSNLSIIRSSPPGLSRARNAALTACETPYIVYLDDDATPKPGWLEAILSAFKAHQPSVIAGPIYPDWPGAQPDWLPQKYVGCLTILDHGAADRWLSGEEFAYGANMAFKTDALREVGGFNVGLGRKGGSSLLSEEELETQLMLRKRDHRTFYAAAAGVTHKVHADRLTRNFFRARMAWQAVSSLLRDPPLKHFDWSRQEIRTAADKLGLNEFVSKLMTCSDADAFSAQLDLIYHLFAILLESKDLDDLMVETTLAATAGNAPAQRSNIAQPGHNPYALNAPILPTTRHLIVEGQPAHFYLYALYGDLQQAQVLLFPHPMWYDFNAALAYIQRSISASLKTITFVTVDPLIYGPSRRAFLQLVQTSGLSCFGILHRLPENAQQEAALREVAPSLAGIIVLTDELVETLQRRFGVTNVHYLPHHAPLADYVARNRQQIRQKIGASEGQFVFSILGEARRGKGIDLLLDALDHVPADDLQNMFFLIAGRSQHMSADAIERSLIEKKAPYYVDLRSSEDPLKYNVLSDREFGEYIAASDAGLLLYQHEQRNCMSGVAPNYVSGCKPVIALADSVIGRAVAHHDLGIVVEKETPQAVAMALRSALERYRQGWTPSAAYTNYRKEIAPVAVLSALEEILGGREAMPLPLDKAESAMDLPDSFAKYLSDLPLLHSWDGGVTWNTGGFQAEHLAKLNSFLKANLPASPMLLETGAGNSTISLLFLEPSRLISIAPEAELFERIRRYCGEHSIATTSLETHVNGSEWVLPQMASQMREQPPCLDFVLIDGCHNWPMVFVDFFYVNFMLKTGGFIMIDDVNLHSVKELARMLSEQPDFRLVLNLGKSLVFRRISDARTLGEWTEIPYVVRKTNEYGQAPDPFFL